MTPLARPFATLLVANRGEIACRVLRSAHRLGISTVAVYSDVDAEARHVALADRAVRIGPAPASESYLRIDALIDAARRTGADAVHPGYGFLSENADFADACAAAGLVFVGPSPAAMRAMGDKAEAKRRLRAAGIACADGTEAEDGVDGSDGGDGALMEAATRLGLPLLVKAVAGGGGRGQRRVDALAALPEAIAAARREAERAFGDGRLMLERLIEPARHVEVQLLADAHGRVLALGDRDCSTQRRRQKIVEEAPAPGLADAQRAALARDAAAAAVAVGYVGAGTVEFLLDADGRHHFLEMNTRLQVEHPVTEAVTGVDLVEWQLRIAAGEPLPWTQARIRCDGHAVEARLVAEEPANGWAPRTGRVRWWRPDEDAEADGGGGVRIDHGLLEGDEIGPHYDGLLAKFVAHGRDRADALRRLRRAIGRTPLVGLRTNAAWLAAWLCDPAFVAGPPSTTTVERSPLDREPAPSDTAWRVAAARLGGAGLGFELALSCGAEQRRLPVPVGGVEFIGPPRDGWHVVRIDGVRRRVLLVADGPHALWLAFDDDGAVHRFVEPRPGAATAAPIDPRRITAPVAGTLARLRVAVGDRVAAGDPIACVEAMKMELWQHAGVAAVVRALHAQPGASVAAGALLVELEPQPEGADGRPA